MAAPDHSRWLDRIGGAAIGAIATAWWLWPRAEHDDVIEAGEVAPVAEVAHAAVEAIVAPPVVAVPPTIAVSSNDGPAQASDSGVSPEADAVDEPPTEPASTAIEPRADSASPATVAPELPLPRMPGDTRLSTSSRFDEASKSWIVKAAYRVVAREHHVVAFYRKALTDQGLTVTHSQAQPSADGSVKTYLHGKNGRVHAQVGIAPRTDVLETRVWILWRTRA